MKTNKRTRAHKKSLFENLEEGFAIIAKKHTDIGGIWCYSSGPMIEIEIAEKVNPKKSIDSVIQEISEFLNNEFGAFGLEPFSPDDYVCTDTNDPYNYWRYTILWGEE